MGDFLVEQILDSVGEQQSPIKGHGKFRALSKSYKAFKQEEGSGTDPNLELTGSMLDALTFRTTGSGIELGIFGKDAPKADGHNNFSGESKLPLRRFLPDEGESFKPSIQKEVDRIIADAVAEDFGVPDEELDAVASKTELYDVLKQVFTGLSRPEIRMAVFRSEEWTLALKTRGLLTWLE